MPNRKLGKPTDQRVAMLRNLTTALLWNGRIITTEARAKDVRPIAEKIITLGVAEYKNSTKGTKEIKNDKDQIVEVETVVDIGFQFIYRHMRLGIVTVLELARHSHIEHWKRLCTNIFRQLEKLEEAQAIALEIVGIEAMGEGIFPTVFIERTVLYRSDSVFPLIAGGKIHTLYNATTGEAQHTGMLVGKSLCQISAHTVFSVLESIDGKQTDMLQINGIAAVEIDAQGSLVHGDRRLELHLIACPLAVLHLDLCTCKLLTFAHGRGVYQLHGNLGSSFERAGPHGEAISFSLLHTDTKEALIDQSRAAVGMTRITEAHIMRTALKRTIIE